MKKNWIALLSIFATFALIPSWASATDNAGDFGIVAGSNASFGTSGSNGGIAVGAGYANTYDAPPSGLIVQGNAGVGTPAPVSSMDVEDDAPTGTISSSGTTVTGSGTNFTSVFSVGDQIVSATDEPQVETITAIANDTSLTTSSSFSPSLGGGTQWQRVGSTFNAGYVGIGISNPLVLLQVYNDNAAIENKIVIQNAASFGSQAYAAEGLILGSPGTQSGGFEYFPDSDGTFTAGITGAVTKIGNYLGGSLQVDSEGGDSDTISFQINRVTDMFIANSGNVGLGTVTPTSILSLNGGSAQTFWMERSVSVGNNLTVQAGGAVSGGSNESGGNLILSSGISTGTGTANIQFQIYPAGSSGTADNTAMTAATLSASGASGSDAATTLQANAGSGTNQNGGALIIASGISTGTGTSSISFKVYSAGSSGSSANSATTAMTIASTGNVGIGTTTPSTTLQVTGTTTSTYFSGNGASLTNLNASSLSSGTVPTAQLGSGTASSTTYLRGDQTWSALPASGRTLLTTTTNFYVAPTGSDSNPCTSTSKCLTINHALNYVQQNYDLGGQTVNINVADGTYTTAVTLAGPFVGGTPNLIGDVSTPANCIISVTAPTYAALTFSNGANINIEGFEIVTTTSGSHLWVTGAGTVVNIIGAMNYGASAGTGMIVYNGGQVYIDSSYTISGTAPNQHIYVNNGSVYLSSGITVTISGNPVIGAYYLAKNLGYITAASITYSGTTTNTGYKYQVSANGLIETNGATGSIPGTNTSAATQGQCL